MTYRVEFTSTATKNLNKIPKKQRLMILAWIKDNLHECENPRNIHGSKQLQGTDSGWRWRVGSYRILGCVKDEILEIKVIRVGHRQGIYTNIPKI